jgi:glycosyltransferase involved in cell wall biosynthesis
MQTIHQLIAGASVGDAITNYAFEVRGIFRDAGVRSDIFAPYQHTTPELRQEVLPAAENLGALHAQGTTLLYHFSIGSELTEFFRQAPGRKVLCYHNITPEKYFRSISDQRAKVLLEGREELKSLRSVPDIALAVSRFNASELEEFGYRSPQVIPLTLNESYLKATPSRRIIGTYGGDVTNFLFVGRVSPNKKLEDVLKVFYYYHRTINPSSRLIFAGSYVGLEKYCTYLRSLAAEMGLQNVIFTGHISLEDLLGYYACSTLFLSMSEHEGVCIPLIESMHFRKPVFALAEAAVPETLGGAGVLIRTKDFRAIAEMIDCVLKNAALLGDILDRQTERTAAFHKSGLKDRLKAILGF